jgi:bacillithiol biosynthesis cysteine-adding enzyme BshC
VPDSIADAYRLGAARDFFGAHFADRAARAAAVRRAARRLVPGVATALEAQNARLALSPAREAHLAALRHGAAAVVTGQQVGLFLGPLYTLYKAATAIRVARTLAEESGQPVVPVFWLQTEDHDLPEINVCHVPVPVAAPLTLTLPAASAAERVSIAHRRLPAAVSDCLEQLRAALAERPHAAEHLARLARHYRPEATWGAAFAGVLAELFAPEGLVLIDPRDAALAQEAVPVHARALAAAAPIAAALLRRIEALAAAGFSAPVHVRPGAPLSFYHPEGATGPRHRLAPAADGFVEVGGDRVHTLAALREALSAAPLRFSASALLRPILQDSLLPTAAYVGGPGEVAYCAQLAPLYEEYGLPMPLIVPRASFRLLDHGAHRALTRLRLNAADLSQPDDELLARVRGTPPLGDAATVARTLLASFERTLDHMTPALAETGPGVAGAADKTRATVSTAVARLAAKYERAWWHRDEEVIAQIRRLKHLLQPHGEPQERSYGPAYFAACCGDRALVERLIAAVAPFDSTTQDLVVP